MMRFCFSHVDSVCVKVLCPWDEKLLCVMFTVVKNIAVTNAPVIVKPDLRIAGYQFTATVTNKGKPLTDVRLTLYSEVKPELSNCKAVSSVKGVETAKFSCSIGATSAEGRVVVPCLPSGTYFITAEYKNGDTEFQFKPSVEKLVVKDRATTVSFSVSGFTARGRVVVGKKGVSGAEVIVQGKKITETDANGYYTLQALTVSIRNVTNTILYRDASFRSCSKQRSYLPLATQLLVSERETLL
ncbi:unnamed protein product [Haemonchus placei]|uniref:MG2 domain-containing protein n=1 Tax=Haemonchus placei TaxID=6290 RepID=A0A0N4VXB1_HAEPC|nr:unnamed protein product [Haemonchus placei]